MLLTGHQTVAAVSAGTLSQLGPTCELEVDPVRDFGVVELRPPALPALRASKYAPKCNLQNHHGKR